MNTNDDTAAEKIGAANQVRDDEYLERAIASRKLLNKLLADIEREEEMEEPERWDGMS